ncbi:MAG TPA: hypothetical protein VF169_21885 [Albitalea sp.]|uniref:hypothetical protein n=1 Tax=Piscinibacter sp. TaxID=1903157 RepID=UPI002ED5771B
MSFEIAAAALVPASPGATAGAAAAPLQAGYGVSLTDIGGFQRALDGAAARLDAKPVTAPSQAAQQLFKPFEHINGEALRLSADAKVAEAAGREMSPGEMVMLTVRCQEFMFHCQLTSNIANRTSDGLQQLFRQQA